MDTHILLILRKDELLDCEISYIYKYFRQKFIFGDLMEEVDFIFVILEGGRSAKQMMKRICQNWGYEDEACEFKMY